jgi:CitMHS family citrate-Mg2+:H+ or citrate-Ca2+:H+ symporter
MSRLVLTACTGLGAGVMNVLPWGGPTARAATTAGVAANDLWVPLFPAQVAGLVAAFAVAAFLGRREQRRLGLLPVGTANKAHVSVGAADPATRLAVDPARRDFVAEPTPAPVAARGHDAGDDEQGLRRPRLLWVNAILTLATVAALVVSLAPPELVFLVAVVVALSINYPGLDQQTARLNAHAPGAMLMASTLLAAGAFLGILEGTGMIDAMAAAAAGAVPASAAPALPLLVGLVGVPLSLLFGPDAYYFGVLPVLIGVGEQFGVSGADLARASLVGEETVGFPISPLTGSFYLLVGLGGVDIGRHIKHLIGWAWLVSVIMLVVAIMTGAVPLWA